MTEILLPSVIFTAIVLVLSSLVLAARAVLLPTGTISIDVNGTRHLEVRAGEKLLWTLAGEGILLPAACGGRGTCGQCRVIVEGDAGALLPTEAGLISRRDVARGTRLACMLSVRRDLSLVIAADLLEARRWHCTVRSNRSIAPLLKEPVLDLPGDERMAFTAGQYVLLEAPAHRVAFGDFEIDPEYRDEWNRYGLSALVSETASTVVRAYSLANPPQQDDAATLVVRIATPPTHAPPATPPGSASSYIFSLRCGDSVTISGPFGDFRASDNDRELVLIAGGAGIAPIRSIILDQLARGTKRPMSFWYGARDVLDLCYREDFDALAERHANFEWHAALSEPRPGSGWNGPRGLVHKVVFEQYLEHHPAPEEAEYYLCGPPLMSAAVVGMLEDLGVDRQSVFYDDFGS